MTTFTLTSYLVDVGTVTQAIQSNKIYTDAKDSLEKALDNVDVTAEEKDKLLSSYLQNFSIPALQMAFDSAAKIPIVNLEREKLQAEVEIASQQKGEAAYKKLAALATIKKQYGFKNATTEALGESTNDGLIDEQIQGFKGDMGYKAAKLLNEGIGMKAQNDIAPESWEVAIIKIAVEMMTKGKINVITENDTTVVHYKSDATGPDGLLE